MPPDSRQLLLSIVFCLHSHDKELGMLIADFCISTNVVVMPYSPDALSLGEMRLGKRWVVHWVEGAPWFTKAVGEDTILFVENNCLVVCSKHIAANGGQRRANARISIGNNCSSSSFWRC